MRRRPRSTSLRAEGASTRNLVGRLAHDERGIALVVALGMMLVLTIALTSTIYFTSASGRHANLSNAGQRALALAEAGLNNAVAQIAAHYPNPTTAGDPSWIDDDFISPVPYEGGTTTWSGSFDSATNTWTVTGRGSVLNPTGGGDITRTVSAKIPVSLVPPPFTQYGLFVDDATGSTCTVLSVSRPITLPVYSRGCFTLDGSTVIEEPSSDPASPTTVSVNIGGELRLGSGSARIGTASRPIDWLAAGGGCVVQGSPVTCSTHARIKSKTYGTFIPVSLPTVDMAAEYAKANWSSATCTTGSNPFDTNAVRDSSLATTNLVGASYDCTATDSDGNVVGRLGWNNSTSTVNGIPPKTLLIQGRVFLDRSVSIGSNQGFAYTGSGTMYVNGTVSLQGIICGPGSSWNGTPKDCGSDGGLKWNPHDGEALLIVVGNAANASTALSIGAGAIAEAGFWITRGNVGSTGNPDIRGSVYVDNGYATMNGSAALQAFINLPAGAPTGGQYTLGSAIDFTTG